MSMGLLALVALAYLWVGAGYWQSGRTGMFLAFAAYAIANIGFIIDLLEHR